MNVIRKRAQGPVCLVNEYRLNSFGLSLIIGSRQTGLKLDHWVTSVGSTLRETSTAATAVSGRSQ
jgi:hypothetical protein